MAQVLNNGGKLVGADVRMRIDSDIRVGAMSHQDIQDCLNIARFFDRV